MGEGTLFLAMRSILAFLLPWGEGQDEGSDGHILLDSVETLLAGKNE